MSGLEYPMSIHATVGREARGGRLDHHDVCRGGYAAAVFSGTQSLIGEWANEPTAGIPWKFAMRDPRGLADDFASGAGRWLEPWLESDVRPIDGVCFVLSDGGHPAIEILDERGAVEGEHFIVLDRMSTGGDEDEQRRRIEELLNEVGAEPISLLGYGDQGQRLRRLLCDEFDVHPEGLLIHDCGHDSRSLASAHGHSVVELEDVLRGAGAVISSPLFRVERFAAVIAAARAAGRPVYDNAGIREAGRAIFSGHGALRIDPGAARSLRVSESSIEPGGHGLTLEFTVVRQDLRRFAEVEVPHLHGPYRLTMGHPSGAVDLARASSLDRRRRDFVAIQRAFVGLLEGSATAVFAARELAAEFWPASTRRAFPSVHPAEMGATVFERILRRHVDRAETAMASQSSAQQTMLGLVAAAYSTGSAIIEIGSALGGTALLMTAATIDRGGPFISIDPATGSRDVMRFTFGREGLLPRLRQIISTSDEAIAGLRRERITADTVFIDGLHTYDATVSDIRNYRELVRPGGALLVHDAEPARYGVLQAVMELLVPDPGFRLLCAVDGLLVFERKVGA